MGKLTGKLNSINEYIAGEPVVVRFELTNDSGEDILLLKWFTPLEGLHSDCLDVKRDGERVEYDGPLLKRAAPGPDSYISIPAGKTVTTDFEVSTAYQVSSEGSYVIELRSEVRGIVSASKVVDFWKSNADERLAQSETEPLSGGKISFKVLSGTRPKRTAGESARAAEEQGMKLGPSAAVLVSDAPPEAGGPIRKSAKEPSFNGGDSSQRAVTRTAHFDGYGLTTEALGRLKDNAEYKEWFGVHSAANEGIVKGNFTKVQSKLENDEFTYDLTGVGCPAGTYAYTYKGTRKVWLCSLFWNSSPTGQDSKAGTIVHEHTHASAGTDDIQYGADGCRQLAKTRPADAIKNADSHEYYAEKVFTPLGPT